MKSNFRVVSRCAASSQAAGHLPTLVAVLSPNLSHIAQISRTWLSLIDQTTTDKNIAALEDAREVTDDSGLEPKPFPFSAVFIFTEQVQVTSSTVCVHSETAKIHVRPERGRMD